MRTGTLIVFVPPLNTSPPAIASGRCARTASRTLSLCRSQSRAPRENRSYQPAIVVLLDVDSSLLNYGSCQNPPIERSLLRQQRRDVVQSLLCTVFVVTVFGDQPLLYSGDFLLCVIVGARAGGDQTQNVAAFREQILLDRFVHARVPVQ